MANLSYGEDPRTRTLQLLVALLKYANDETIEEINIRGFACPDWTDDDGARPKLSVVANKAQLRMLCNLVHGDRSEFKGIKKDEESNRKASETFIADQQFQIQNEFASLDFFQSVF